jgi:hypothetical protein
MNTALKVLLQLAKEDVSSVAVFNSFLKDTLYHIDSLDSKQVGWLFDTFSLLALTVKYYLINANVYIHFTQNLNTLDGSTG